MTSLAACPRRFEGFEGKAQGGSPPRMCCDAVVVSLNVDITCFWHVHPELLERRSGVDLSLPHDLCGKNPLEDFIQ